MRRTRKPWYRKQTGEWYVSFGGEQHSLDIRGDKEATKDAAEDAFHRFMVGQTGKPAEKQALTAADVCTLFLDTSKTDNALSTYEWYRHFVESFSRKHGRVRIRDLEPFHVTNWIAGHR